MKTEGLAAWRICLMVYCSLMIQGSAVAVRLSGLRISGLGARRLGFAEA